MSSQNDHNYAALFRKGWDLIRKLSSAEKRGDRPLGWFEKRHLGV